jgi:hypothetical protein
VPAPLDWPATEVPNAVMLELPLGGIGEDALAVYGSLRHRSSVVNGLSGYDPPHYVLLRWALKRRDPLALTAFAERAPLRVAVRTERDAWDAYLMNLPGTVRLQSSGRANFYIVPSRAIQTPRYGGRLRIRGVQANDGRSTVALVDGMLETVWTTPGPQRGDEALLIEFDDPQTVCAVRIAQGAVLGVADTLMVEAQAGDSWQHVWSGPLLGLAVAGALEDPRRVEMTVDMPRRSGVRALRLRQVGQNADNRWSIAELAVLGCHPTSTD